MSRKICGIYKIRNKVNGKFYIGSSNNIISRFSRHRNALMKGTHPNVLLQRAYHKYGEENLEYLIVEKCTENEKLKREQFYIDTVKPQYNISKSATAPMQGRKHSEETKKKFKKRIVLRGKESPSYGKKWTPEQRKKLIEKRIGVKRSESFKKKMSEISKKKNRWKDLAPYIESKKESIVDNEGNEFESLTEAAKFHGVKPSTVCDVLKGRSKTINRKIKVWYKTDPNIEYYKLVSLTGIRRNYHRIIAEICHGKSKYLIGSFNSVEEAVLAYNKEAAKLRKELIDINTYYEYKKEIDSRKSFQYMKLPLNKKDT